LLKIKATYEEPEGKGELEAKLEAEEAN